ncbi:hypothetical protein D9M68_874500 [compost metagenome]
MRTVSFQGTSLSESQRRTMAMRQQVQQSFLSAPLQQQVAETVRVLDERKEQGAKPERVWFLDFEAKGTPCIAEYMGFTL